MDVFNKQFRTFRVVMSIVGFWPYSQSIYRKIQRIFFATMMSSYIVYEVIALVHTKKTAANIIRSCSHVSVALIYFERYVSFSCNLSNVKLIFDCIQTEIRVVQDQNEMDILTKYICNSSRIITVFLYMSYFMVIALVAVLLHPTILDLLIPLNESRTRYLSYITNFPSNKVTHIDLMSFYIIFINCIGLLTLACTESLLNTFVQHISSLFKITSYRIEKAITNATETKFMTKQNYTDFRRIVDVHRRLTKFVNTIMPNFVVPYMIITTMCILSSILCIHRMLMALLTMNDKLEILVTIMIVVCHVAFLFLTNYIGQLVIDSSQDVFFQSYNSAWYCIPLSAQKLLLFVMMRSAITFELNFSGIFVPGYKGFSTIMSMCFSFVTTMYSTCN